MKARLRSIIMVVAAAIAVLTGVFYLHWRAGRLVRIDASAPPQSTQPAQQSARPRHLLRDPDHPIPIGMAPSGDPASLRAKLQNHDAKRQAGFAPPLERERQAQSDQRSATSPAPSGFGATPGPEPSVKIDGAVECGTPMIVRQISPTHYTLDLQSSGWRDWFMFHATGLKGKTVRFDVTGDRINFRLWRPMNPVYTYAADLDDPATYDCPAASPAGSPAWNGSILPDTSTQQWHYVANCWEPDGNTFSFVQHFDHEAANFAMRVPYTPGYNRRYFQRLAENPVVQVIQVGSSKGNRPLLMAKISGGDEAEKTRPCVLI